MKKIIVLCLIWCSNCLYSQQFNDWTLDSLNDPSYSNIDRVEKLTTEELNDYLLALTNIQQNLKEYLAVKADIISKYKHTDEFEKSDAGVYYNYNEIPEDTVVLSDKYILFFSNNDLDHELLYFAELGKEDLIKINEVKLKITSGKQQLMKIKQNILMNHMMLRNESYSISGSYIISYVPFNGTINTTDTSIDLAGIK